MTRRTIRSLAVAACLLIAAIVAIVPGCRPSCDSIPTEGLASVRILNAVSNSALLLVYVDGKLFDSCWYDIDNKYYNWNHNHVFGYRNTYLSDGSELRAGFHHVAGMDATTRDTVATWNGVLNQYRQSLIFPGKMNGAPSQTPQDRQNSDRRVRYMNDVTRGPEARSFARFINAVPDIGGTSAGGLDVYFANTPTTVSGKAHPDLRIHFDSISYNNGLDIGTGLDSNDYLEFPAQVPGLLIMPVNDTNTNDAILNFPHPLPTSEFLATIVVRGETNPSGTDPIASVLVLEDGQQAQGNFAFDILSLGVRMVNATKYDSLSLLISNPLDETPSTPRTFSNLPYPTQIKVTDITPDSVSDYMALGTTPPYYTFWFGSFPNSSDTLFHFSSNDSDKVATVIIPPLNPNTRYTFVAIDTIPHDAGKAGINLLELVDSVSTPDNVALGRVRFVNATSDYSASFTFSGQKISLGKRGIAYADTAAGTYTISINSGAGSITLPVQSGSPTTVFFMPAQPGDPIPYRISTQ